MADDFDDVPTGKRDQLRYSLGNLIDSFGQADSLLVGVVLNLALAAIGGAVWLAAGGWLAWAGAVWAFVHLAALVVGVIEG